MKPALLIIDMQNDFVRPDGVMPVVGAESIIGSLKNVLGLFRERGLPVVHVLRVHRPDGSDVEITRRDLFSRTPFAVQGTRGAAVIDELAPKDGEHTLQKTRMSAFMFTELDILLRTIEVDKLFVAGIQTPNCIRATIFDAMAYNYRTFLVEDAVAARTGEIHRANVQDMANIGIGIVSAGKVADVLADSHS